MSLGNVGKICTAHAEETKAKVQGELTGVSPESLIGKFVKLAIPIPEQGNTERLWFRVIGLAETPGEQLRGELNNDPIFVDFKCGDLIEFSMHEIQDIYNE